MAKEIPDLVAEVRAGTGKGAARQARRDNLVPAVVYGGGSDPIALTMKYNYLLKHLKAGRFLSTLFNLKVEGEKDVRVICRGVQRDVVKDTPLHVDFMRLRANSRIDLFIHVDFINHEKAPGLKKGGTLVIVRNEVELNVNASDIPDHITVDLTGLQVGDVIHIKDVDLPKGAKPTIDRNFVIGNISAPSSLRSAGDDETETEEDATEE
ncbi:50S ribosomal protein L25/general stress protein Ctc [Pseudorhodobacter wandonensis]|jgi:large subunit ribosomal protein L25|uniref:50S ribosomal protein L25/general stress protein Ctc n=1 Tax=Pseudorhodobacter wandonensis TaxID=1120568 RepID=UPI00067B0862|nr:50S ribosomal protein L25/general stress protein Ctc [Pseudorhodobacter wandonensis]